MSEKEIETFHPSNRQQWREWLQENHGKKQSVWLIYYKRNSICQQYLGAKQLRKHYVLAGLIVKQSLLMRKNICSFLANEKLLALGQK
jgi:uncharacterized protein YdeI (YjbR/CyaY-like superfamily)